MSKRWDEVTVSRLLTLVYEAAEDPTLWPTVFEGIGTAIGAPARGFTVEDVRNPQSSLSLSAGIDPTYKRLYNEYYESINILLERARPMFAPGRVISTHQICSDQEILATEYYNDFLRKQPDWFYVVGGCVSASGSQLSITHFTRGRAAGDFGCDEIALLELLMPHLQRATRLHRIFSRGRDTAACLDSLPAAVFLTDAAGGVDFMNRAASDLIQDGDGVGLDAQGTLVCANRRLPTALARAAQTVRGEGLGAGELLSVERRSGRRPYIALVSPIRRTDPFSAEPRPGAVVFVVDPEREPPSVAALLRRLYQATPAEARLAEILMSGRDLDDACEELGVTRNTVRTQLKHLFEKMGVRRQAELVALLLRIASPLPRGF